MWWKSKIVISVREKASVPDGVSAVADQLAAEANDAFARQLSDARRAVIEANDAFRRQLSDVRQVAMEASAALAHQLRTWQPSSEVAENLRRYRRCRELRQSVTGIRQDSKGLQAFVRNELSLWRTKSDAQDAMREAVEDALLTVEVGSLPATANPYQAIKSATRRGYRARMPSFLPPTAPASAPRNDYWHGTVLSRSVVAAVALERVCARLRCSRTETAVLLARFQQQWDTWPAAERLFGLKPGSLEPLRKRLEYWRPKLAELLVLDRLRSYGARHNKK
jgi:hypothetical protein